MSRDLSYFDSAELALVATKLGVGHPTGQPLHTLVGFLFAHIPFVPTLIGLNALSAIAGAGAALFALSMVESGVDERVVDAVATLPDTRVGTSGNVALAAWRRVVYLLSFGVLALHPVVAEPSTRIEVYSLATMLALWACARALNERRSATQTNRWPMSFVLAGLAASTHPVNGFVSLLIVVWILWGSANANGMRARVKRVAGCASAFCLGLLPHAYLLVRPWFGPGFVWGGLRTASELRHYFTAADYRHNQQSSFGDVAQHTHELLFSGTSIARLAVVVTALICVVGLYRAFARTWSVAATRVAVAALGALLLGTLAVAQNTVFRSDNPDYFGYLGIAYWLLAVTLFYTLQQLAPKLPFVGFAAVVMLSIGWWPTGRTLARSDDHLVRAHTEAFLQECPPNAFAFMASDHLVASALYLQEVEHRHDDLVIVPIGLASSEWYWQLLQARGRIVMPTLRGPGGVDARLSRLLVANPARAYCSETLQAFLPSPAIQPFGFGSGAERSLQPELNAYRRWSHRASTYDEQSLLSFLAYRRAESIHVGRAAGLFLAAGADLAFRGIPTTFAVPSISFQQTRVLGDPARNAFALGVGILHATPNEPDHAGRQLIEHAAQLGLLEARLLETQQASSVGH